VTIRDLYEALDRRVELTKHEDKNNRIFESACHGANYGLLGLLANVAPPEKAFAEGKGPDPATMDIAPPGGGER
jgi:hypothetical protein